MTTIARIIVALLQIYMVLISIRIILGWSGWRHDGFRFLSRVVDPYLNLFRGLTFLRVHNFDLTPIAAIMVLNLAVYLLYHIAFTGVALTVAGLLVFLFRMIWNFVAFLIGLMVVLALVRLIGFAFPTLKHAPIWRALDGLLMPPVTRLGMVLRRGFMTYRTGLILFALFGVILFILGGWAMLLLGSFILTYVPF